MRAVRPPKQAPFLITDLSVGTREKLDRAFVGIKRIGLDCEGVNLGRNGMICMVQLCTPGGECFILDVMGKGKNDPLIDWLRTILESKAIQKVIHDCRMDSDALQHHLGISLAFPVHDTSVWHECALHETNRPYNAVLLRHGLAPNPSRDPSVYNSNPSFWATRPVTEHMMDWAAGDLAMILQLADLQESKVSSTSLLSSITMLTIHFVTFARGAKVKSFLVRDAGAFIGPGGFNIRRLQKESRTLIYSEGPRSYGSFLVYYDDTSDMEFVMRFRDPLSVDLSRCFLK